ncbi:ABC transporter ATP-binding protein [Phytohabitans sp. ZYX-F-186]|uniref:ABC transporter ATP-binding protein n=1 Tax=Phytohabitans maris TaxID=3071409 RepID=A0ABU0ZNS3_9ACTN|nr:ABC transporter ATP-binding protein [Phytohabitans sp. ZYX-F-186]MDQ7908057.1 ABC transporter ATP-binding protein [Phytohabitans sp. ZYX-F-186]
MSTNGRPLRWSLRSRWRMAELVGLCVAITASYAGQGLLLAVVVDDVIEGGGLAGSVPALVGLVAVQAARAALQWRREVAAAGAAAAVKEAVRDDLYAQLLRLGPADVRRRRTGAVQSTLVDGVEALDAYVGRFLPQAIAAIVGAAAIAGFLLALDPVVGTVVLACALVVPVVPQLSQKVLASRMDPWMAAYRALYAENLDAIQGMATLKVFGAARRRGWELTEKAKDFCRVSIRLCAVTVLYVGVVGLAVGFGTAFAAGLGAVRNAEGALPALSLLMILLLTRECFRPLRDLQNAFHAGYPALSAATGIFEILDADPPVRPPAQPRTPRGRSLALDFDAVTFTYPGRAEPAVRDLTLGIGAGEHVAVVGRSGAGKTTLIGLLLRWFDPQRGAVLLGGVPVTGWDLDALRRQVAVVSQDTYLFHRSVRDNLTLARPDATAAELREALAAANAVTFVDALPDGLDTVVGERGMKLSGGERQRLAIARALLADAPVLVLDEATSSVDGANERSIAQALRRAAQGRTTLTIAHRLSTVRAADRIVVLDRGAIAESGSHDELLARPGAFARLVAAGTTREENPS